MAVESLKTLRRRLRTIKNTGKITRAMEMVSASKLRRALAVLVAGRPYAAKLQELLLRLAAGSELGQHPLFREREGRRKVLVIYTSDRGLAGSFNANIIKCAEDVMKAEPDAQWQLVCIGRKGRDYFQRRNVPIIESLIGLGGQADSASARQIGKLLLDLFTSDRCDEVWLVYSAFISTVAYRPTLVRYLPVAQESIGTPKEENGRTGEIEYILEPSAQEVFDQILPRYLSSRIYITMTEVATSENSARMISMNNATKNCSELSESLTLRMNKARQGAITKELLEIVGGAEALKLQA